jgi:flavin reductase (DIM6/NTAB) family NADH-FMN oxidoreductase RutF
MDINPNKLSPEEHHKLLIGAIVPRPIAVVSTISAAGIANLAPFSFFCGVGSNPMTLAFAPANKVDGTEKDTLRNCSLPSDGGNGEFVVNVATESWAAQMAGSAEPLPYGTSEFDLTQLTAIASHEVKPPRVAESPISFECRTLQVIRTNPGGTASGNLVLGEVIVFHVDDDLMNDRLHIDPERLKAIGRMGGFGYVRTHDRYDMPPGRAALELDR